MRVFKIVLKKTFFLSSFFLPFFERHNGPASAAPCQEGMEGATAGWTAARAGRLAAGRREVWTAAAGAAAARGAARVGGVAQSRAERAAWRAEAAMVAARLAAAQSAAEAREVEGGAVGGCPSSLRPRPA